MEGNNKEQKSKGNNNEGVNVKNSSGSKNIINRFSRFFQKRSNNHDNKEQTADVQYDPQQQNVLNTTDNENNKKSKGNNNEGVNVKNSSGSKNIFSRFFRKSSNNHDNKEQTVDVQNDPQQQNVLNTTDNENNKKFNANNNDVLNGNNLSRVKNKLMGSYRNFRNTFSTGKQHQSAISKRDNENNKVVTPIDDGQIAGPSNYNQKIDIQNPIENVPSESTLDDNLKNRLEKFVEYFIKEFVAKLNAYYFILEGSTSKAGKFSNAFSEIAGEGIGGAVGTTLGSLLGSPSPGAKLGGEIGKKGVGLLGEMIGNKHHKKKVINLSDLINKYQQDIDEFMLVLAKMGYDIFQSFEMQFTRVTTSRGENGAMRKLALDAVNRAINYLAEKGGELSSKCIILGESKRKNYYSLNPGFVIKKDELDWNTSELYSKTGIVILDEHRSYYEKRGESKSDEYGFRRLLTSENWGEIKIKYKHISTESSEFSVYKYVLNVEDLEKISNDILKNLKSKGDLLDESRIKEMIIEVKQDLLKIFKLMEENINVQKQDNTILLEEIKQHVISLNDEKMNEFVFKIIENHRELINRFDQLHKTIKETIVPKCNNQAEKSIWFNVKMPVQVFKGRREDLDDLHNMMQDSENPIVVTSVSGLGGIGKTEFTRKYCYEYRQFYNNNVIWIDSETERSSKDSFIRLCKQEKIVIETEEEDDIKQIVKKVYNFVGTRKCLIILDNAENDSVVNVLLPLKEVHPEYTKPHILITSRNRKWEDGIKVKNLKVLKPEDAFLVVKDGLGIKDESKDEEVTNLIHTLGCFPLAIRQAVAYIKEQQEFDDFSITDYLKIYEEEAGSLLKYRIETGISNDYEKTTLTTWKMTMKKIGKQENGPLALDILNIIAYLLPDGIYRQMFFELSSNENEIKSAVSLLVKYSMVNAEDKQSVLSIHRLVQFVTRYDLKSQKKEEKVLEIALNLLVKKYNIWEFNVRSHILNIWGYGCNYKQIVSKFKNSVYDGTNLFHFLVDNNSVKTTKAVLAQMKAIATDEEFDEVINSRNEYSESLLSGAVRQNQSDIIKCLLNYGAIIDDDILAIPCYYGNLEIVQFLIDKGAKININSDQYTPLYAACLNDNLEIVQFLIDKGAEINTNCDQYTPLYEACQNGNLEIVHFLIDKGANTIFKHGHTLLHYACYWRNIEIINYLINKTKIDVNDCNNDQKLSPLHFAVFSKNIFVIKYLLKQNADINAIDKQGASPLYYSAMIRNWDLVKYLIRKNAAVTISNNTLIGKNNFTVLHIAAAYDEEEIVRFLIDKGVDKDIGKSTGLTPLDIAKLFNSKNVIKYLSEISASFNTSSEIICNLKKYLHDHNIPHFGLMKTETESETDIKNFKYYEIVNFTDLIIFIYRFNQYIKNGGSFYRIEHVFLPGIP